MNKWTWVDEEHVINDDDAIVEFHRTLELRDRFIKEIVEAVDYQLKEDGTWLEVRAGDLEEIDKLDQRLLDIYNNVGEN